MKPLLPQRPRPPHAPRTSTSTDPITGTEGSQHLPAAQDDGADAFRARYGAMRRELEDELAG